MIGLATIFDNQANEGALLQGYCLLKMLGGKGILFERRLEAETRSGSSGFQSDLPLSQPYSEFADIAAHVNSNYSHLFVGSDEVWKFSHSGFKYPYLFTFPNHFFGDRIEIPLIALAVSSGPTSFTSCPAALQSEIQRLLIRFDLIYVRDRHTANNLRQLHIDFAGILPDPTFAYHFQAPAIGLDADVCFDLVDGEIDNQQLDPISWFAAHREMSSAVVYRTHSLLACIRGGTPCLIRDRRRKSREIVADFDLPEACWGHSIQRVREQWPYDEIAQKCDDHMNQWKAVCNELDQRYQLSHRPHDTENWRPGATITPEEPSIIG
ncbi:hypothetical protein RMSM_03963 [Rhodopirellula maiorica SM1]|uniref:Polysaccharide pyruvyl transferase domain-containing protein n=1 Tax=Rhodopirellula maiorica SM1 TaxID=1265738 RepID=M5RIG9_9BACT|nr:polysaccharide pyruvyl transferase family protein [Rhodopirellula maiorica]EMI19113.1 hypothetical protein RMSM_03963 [Rhodopirellula maiorica SM1]